MEPPIRGVVLRRKKIVMQCSRHIRLDISERDDHGRRLIGRNPYIFSLIVLCMCELYAGHTADGWTSVKIGKCMLLSTAPGRSLTQTGRRELPTDRTH